MRFSILITFFITSFFAVQAQITDNLQMVWNDEFNGTELDPTKWKPAPQWFRQGGSYWSDKNHSLDGNGILRLDVTQRNDSVFCGAIRTHQLFDKKYGYFEVRCKVPQMKGGWGAFWLMPYGNKPGQQGNDGTEIDVFESINGWNGKVNHAIHWDGYGTEHQKASSSIARPDIYDNKYHLFGMKWTPTEYIFYIDNVESWRTSAGGVSDVNQYLKLTLEVTNGTWAGDWNQQTTKPIYWYIDYVRVYNHEPVVTNDAELNFTILENNQTYAVGDQVKMNVELTGDFSQVDEIRFIDQIEGGQNNTQKTDQVSNSQTTYWHTWVPSQPGNYALKAAAYKNGNYVTNVVANITIAEPFEMNYTLLNEGDTYNLGDEIKMHVDLTGDVSSVDEIRFISEKSGESNNILKTSNVTTAQTYWHKFFTTETGNFNLKVLAFNNSSYVKEIKVNVNVVAPLKLEYRALETGQTYTIGEEVKMHIDALGDLSQADEVRFYSQKIGESDVLLKTTSVTEEINYWNKWTPTESGAYKLKVAAFKNGNYVTNVVADITVETPLVINNPSTQQSYSIYPNPSDKELFIPILEKGSYEIFNLEGQVVSSGKITKGQNVIDISKLPKSKYVLKTKNSKEVKTHNFIKN